jgi:hypothetical protein
MRNSSLYVSKAFDTVFSYGVSKSSSNRRWRQDTLYYLQRGCSVRLVVARRQGRSPSFPSIKFMFQRLQQNFIEVRPRCNLQSRRRRREQDECLVPLGHVLLYRWQNTGARTEHWGTPAVIFLGVENSPATKTSNFLSVRKEAITLKVTKVKLSL